MAGGCEGRDLADPVLPRRARPRRHSQYHGKVQVVATLTYPAEVYDQPEGASDDVLMQVLEEKAEEAEDDEEGSLKATRIDAKKRGDRDRPDG